MWRDYVVYGLLILLVAGGLIYAASGIFGRHNKGEWDAQARRLGEYQARHWTYKEQVRSLKPYLLADAPDTHFWPALAGAMGYEALANKPQNGQIGWRSALIEPLGEPRRLYFTAEFPQRADAAEIELPEVLFSRLRDDAEADALLVAPFSQNPDAHDPVWNVRTSEPEAIGELLTSDFRHTLSLLPGVAQLHLVSKYVTFVLVPGETTGERVAVTDTYVAIAQHMLQAIPLRFWA